MEMFIDIAGIVFVCVTANHLGLVKAIEDTFEIELPVINCVKCFSYWCVFTYMLFVSYNVIAMLAVSFLTSYIALWLELLEGFIDKLYIRLYEKITATDSDNAVASNADNGNSASTVP